MDIEALALPEVKLLRTRKHDDERGFLSEVYSRQVFAAAGLEMAFVQENHVYSRQRHTLRGLHFQVPPAEQAKLVRVVRGAVLDVAVDLREGSPSYGHHVAAELSAEAWNQMLVPAGFAHGLLTLLPETEVVYKLSAPFDPALERGLLWNDPALAIDWPVTPDAVILSDKDRVQPRLAELPGYFRYRTGGIS